MTRELRLPRTQGLRREFAGEEKSVVSPGGAVAGMRSCRAWGALAERVAFEQVAGGGRGEAVARVESRWEG